MQDRSIVVAEPRPCDVAGLDAAFGADPSSVITNAASEDDD